MRFLRGWIIVLLWSWHLQGEKWQCINEVKLGARTVQSLCPALGSWQLDGWWLRFSGRLPHSHLHEKEVCPPGVPHQSSDGESQLLQHPSKNPFSFTSGLFTLSTLKHRIMCYGLRTAKSKEPLIERSVRVWAAFLLFGWRRQQCHYCGEHILHTCRWKVSLLCCCCCLSSHVLGGSVCLERIVW